MRAGPVAVDHALAVRRHQARGHDVGVQPLWPARRRALLHRRIPAPRPRLRGLPSDRAAAGGGWPELAQQTAQAYNSLPPDERANAVILAHYYSQAAAIDFYGAALGLPHAVSPHLSHWYWAPARLDPSTAVMVNFTLEEGNQLFTDCSR